MPPISIGNLGGIQKVRPSCVQRSPHRRKDAALHYALGLALTRLKQADAALAELTRAAELGPGRARYAYVHAVALHSSARSDDALRV